MEQYQMLFYAGAALMGGAGIAAVIALVAFTITGKRLKAQLEQEYGPRPQGK